MLILPMAVEKNEVRRTPWVSWILIATCVLVHIALTVFFPGNTGDAARRLGEAVDYLAAHPYLSASPALLQFLGADAEVELQKARTAFAGRGIAVPTDQIQDQQTRLNELTDSAIEAVRRLPLRRLGFIPAAPNIATLLTHMFAHAGWLHLIGNMLFFFLSGPFIEDLYGRPLFVALYLVSGLAAAGAHAISASHSMIPMVGASGAIAGVMGAFLWRLSARRIEFLVLPFPIIPAFRFRLVLPAFVVIPLWAAEQFYYASVAPPDSGVAFWAHVGGFVCGLVFAIVVQLLRVEETVVTPAVEREILLEQNPGIERAVDARTAGDFAAARREISAVLQAEPQNLDAWTESWEIALAAEDGEGVGRSGLKLMELLGRAGERTLLWDVVTDPRWRGMSVPSRFVVAVADLLAREGDGRGAIELYQRLSRGLPPQDPLVLRALVSEGEILARAGDPKGAKLAFDRARAHPACSDLWVDRMQRALRSTQPTRDALR